MLTIIRQYKILCRSSTAINKNIPTLSITQKRQKSIKHTKQYPRRIFSGIQPTGAIHIGNYLGAIKEWIRYQETNEDLLLSIVDMHAITIPQTASILRENIYNMAATLIACGIDPDKCILFQQSAVPMHAQLAWIFGCMTTMPKLNQFPQFKEKSEKMKDALLGIFAYPVLQTADILLYKATHVPVGEDQIQHLHYTQHIVQYFNGKYGETFPMPEPVISELTGRIKSLREPTKKMSKSSEYKKSCIFLIDSPDIIRNYVMKAVTDFTSAVTWDPETRPGVSNLIAIHSLMTDKSPEVICKEANGLNTAQYKALVADVIIEKLTPIREEYSRLIDDPNYLNDVLHKGSTKASLLAHECLTEIYEKIGFSGGILSSRNLIKSISQERN
ncbi:hypothetical protein PV325_012017 [Microctonus aethiopoides]|uniref:Tryptophan--tRNA ligase, mitochondrial n=1 Tax=Microctonus aethiopoides TaxID=144406 RepID=A0AA39FYH9_9HYME|nr:hypothetical protein PV325_012017 [Microctonus aethiopoides]KAK0093343.1 hypothetical protein PV326_013768 [Microctonus aethiopoides]KAK0178200.1 hypothetical protein PV328_002174 [Microctonus aethiopoides]